MALRRTGTAANWSAPLAAAKPLVGLRRRRNGPDPGALGEPGGKRSKWRSLLDT